MPWSQLAPDYSRPSHWPSAGCHTEAAARGSLSKRAPARSVGHQASAPVHGALYLRAYSSREEERWPPSSTEEAEAEKASTNDGSNIGARTKEDRQD